MNSQRKPSRRPGTREEMLAVIEVQRSRSAHVVSPRHSKFLHLRAAWSEAAKREQCDRFNSLIRDPRLRAHAMRHSMGCQDCFMPRCPTPGEVRAMFGRARITDVPEFASSPFMLADPPAWSQMLTTREDVFVYRNQWPEEQLPCSCNNCLRHSSSDSIIQSIRKANDWVLSSPFEESSDNLSENTAPQSNSSSKQDDSSKSSPHSRNLNITKCDREMPWTTSSPKSCYDVQCFCRNSISTGSSIVALPLFPRPCMNFCKSCNHPMLQATCYNCCKYNVCNCNPAIKQLNENITLKIILPLDKGSKKDTSENDQPKKDKKKKDKEPRKPSIKKGCQCCKKGCNPKVCRGASTVCKSKYGDCSKPKVQLNTDTSSVNTESEVTLSSQGAMSATETSDDTEKEISTVNYDQAQDKKESPKAFVTQQMLQYRVEIPNSKNKGTTMNTNVNRDGPRCENRTELSYRSTFPPHNIDYDRAKRRQMIRQKNGQYYQTNRVLAATMSQSSAMFSNGNSGSVQPESSDMLQGDCTMNADDDQRKQRSCNPWRNYVIVALAIFILILLSCMYTCLCNGQVLPKCFCRSKPRVFPCFFNDK